MVSAANEAASSINMSEIEANIQANLQAKLEAGATKEDLMAQADDLSSLPISGLTMTGSNNAQAVVKQVLASKGVQTKLPKMVPIAAPKPVAVQVATDASLQAENKASQEKVKEMAQKLGIPFTKDLISLGSNSAISDSLIEKAVAAGKTEAQINAAMATL